MTVEKNTEITDRAFDQAKALDPDLTFTRWIWQKQSENVASGVSHPSLGKNIVGKDDWKERGIFQFNTYKRIAGLTPRSKVVDYGCGTIGVGYHFISFLNSGNYFGLELIPALLDAGREMLGDDFVAQKLPILQVISPQFIAAAVAFAPDMTISTSVVYHIPPDEIDSFLGTLAGLAVSPGARLLFDAKHSATPHRYNISGWSWPLEFYRELLRPWLVTVHSDQKYDFDPYCNNGLFEFVASE